MGNETTRDCHIRDDMIVVRSFDIDAALETLGLEQDSLFDDLEPENPGPEDPPGIDQATDPDLLNADFEGAVQLRDIAGFIRVDDVDTSIQALWSAQIQAAPIHAVGFPSHAGAMPATTFDDDGALGEPTPCRSGIVAIVDTGVVSRSQLPSWMYDSLLYDSVDIEILGGNGPGASHGTFVASLYRRMVPCFELSIAAARPGRGHLDPHPEDGDAPTDELQVAQAIGRLMNRHYGDRTRVKLLNLSLGAVQCGPGDRYFLALEEAIDAWRRQFGRSAPIFAAGGNSDDPRPVYPGAFPCVRAVAAGEERDQVVWGPPPQAGADRPKVTNNGRAWITDVAPGVRIRGLKGSGDQAVLWDGSSFATAVAGACFLSDATSRQVDPQTGIEWWRDRALDRALIDQLD